MKRLWASIFITLLVLLALPQFGNFQTNAASDGGGGGTKYYKYSNNSSAQNWSRLRVTEGNCFVNAVGRGKCVDFVEAFLRYLTNYTKKHQGQGPGYYERESFKSNFYDSGCSAARRNNNGIRCYIPSN